MRSPSPGRQGRQQRSSRSKSPSHSPRRSRSWRDRGNSSSGRRRKSSLSSSSRSRSPPRNRRSPFHSRSPPRRRRNSSFSQSRSRSRSRSPPPRRERPSSSSRPPPRPRHRSRSPARPPPSRRQVDRREDRGGRGRKQYEWGRPEDPKNEEDKADEVEKQTANFGLSGALASETNTVKGVELKYNEPPEAAKPKQHWRLYVFKGSEQVDLLHLHRQSSYLIGRDRVVVDIPVDHPSCSKQHAVIQFREVSDNNSVTGQLSRKIKPYIIDLESTNGTFVNDEKTPVTRFVELRSKDMLKFGNSSREYVLLLNETKKGES